MKEFKYKTIFSSVIKPVISKEKDIYLAKASLDQLRNLIPQFENDNSYDLTPLAANLFNVNKFNRNDDGVGTEDAISFYKSFIFKPLNLAHKRDVVRGVILSSNLTEFGTDNLIDEETAASLHSPFNVTIGAILWKVVDENLAELVEESNTFLSESYNKIFLSFEVGFFDFDIIKIKGNSKNFEDGVLVTDGEEKECLTSKLKCFGGTGSIDAETRIYRKLKGELIGLGAGLVESPAGYVGPIATPDTSKDNDDLEESDANNKENLVSLIKSRAATLFSLQEALDRVGEIADDVDTKIISHLQTSNVINNNDSNKSNLTKKTMKITNIKDITDDLLKEVTASSLVDFVETELKAASEKFAKEKLEKETSAQELQKKHDDLIKAHETLNKDLETLKATLLKLEQESAAKEKQEKFTVRMASFEDKFELSQEELAVVGSQIKDLDDEQYKLVEANLHILLKNKDKQTIAESKKSHTQAQEAKASENKESKVEQSAQQTVDNAVNNAVNTSKEIAATTVAQTQTLREKYAKAFSVNEFILTK